MRSRPLETLVPRKSWRLKIQTAYGYIDGLGFPVVWIPIGFPKWKGLGVVPIESQPTDLNHQPKPPKLIQTVHQKKTRGPVLVLGKSLPLFFSVPQFALQKPSDFPLTIRQKKQGEKHADVFLLHAHATSMMSTTLTMRDLTVTSCWRSKSTGKAGRISWLNSG